MKLILEYVKNYFRMYGWQTFLEMTAAFSVILGFLKHYEIIKPRKGKKKSRKEAGKL